jgi:serine/threonine protein kinase
MRVNLTITSGEDKNRRFILRPGPVYLVGRATSATIRLEDQSISRRHATLEVSPEGLTITELGSKNGTYVADKRLPANAPTILSEGATLEFGSLSTSVELTGFDAASLQRTSSHRRRDQPLLPDDFELVAMIGGGGYSRVWAAWQKTLRRMVSIKILQVDAGSDPGARERFIREAKLLTRVRSPFVVELHDLLLLEDMPCLIMELVHGPSVKDLLSEGSLPIDRALQIASNVARALQVVGRDGIVHRDIKPGNILIHPEGTAKLADFGIAKDIAASGDITATGISLGTLAYMSPEQVQSSRDVDYRSDLYSLGATLYEMVSGRPPILLSTRLAGLPASIDKILHESPQPVRMHRPDCPRPLQTLLERLLAKAPDQRPASSEEVADELLAIKDAFYPGQASYQDSTTDHLARSRLPERETRDPDLARVLVVDDDPDIRDRMRQLLSERYTVQVTDDPGELFSNAADCDLILLDVHMSMFQGDQLLRVLRKITGHAQKPKQSGARRRAGRPRILYFSSDDEHSVRQLVKDTQADGYVLKSARSEDLLRELERQLRLSHESGTPYPPMHPPMHAST